MTNALDRRRSRPRRTGRRGADEWLTIAARESLDLRFLPENPNDAATTLILRIKGADLNAFRDRRLSREEARKKIEVKQY